MVENKKVNPLIIIIAIVAIVGIFAAVVIFAIPPVELKDYTRSRDSINIGETTTITFNVVTNQNATFNNIQVITSIQDEPDYKKYLSITNEKLDLGSLKNIGAATGVQTVTIKANDVVGSHTTFKVKTTLYVDGKQVNEKGFDLTVNR